MTAGGRGGGFNGSFHGFLAYKIINKFTWAFLRDHEKKLLFFGWTLVEIADINYGVVELAVM